MSVEEHKELERRLREEVWAHRNPEAADRFVDPDVVAHGPLPSMEGGGLEGYKRSLRALFSAFPDAELVANDVIAGDDMISERWTINGTHRADYIGVAATNRRISVQGIDIYRYANGKRVETWTSLDTLGLMRQLGVAPSPAREIDDRDRALIIEALEEAAMFHDARSRVIDTAARRSARRFPGRAVKPGVAREEDRRKVQDYAALAARLKSRKE